MEACYASCTPLANMAEVSLLSLYPSVAVSLSQSLVNSSSRSTRDNGGQGLTIQSCNYYPIDMDINSACVCSASTQGVFVRQLNNRVPDPFSPFSGELTPGQPR